MTLRYANVEAFYTDNPVRRTSGETDYGVWWQRQVSWPRYRVSYVEATGEVYAVELGTTGAVEVLGVVPPDDSRKYYETLDGILEGWGEYCQEPNGLAWVRERLAEVQLL